MMRALKLTLMAVALATAFAGPARASEAVALPSYDWPHASVFGTIDKAAAQRGFQVYSEVCAACHSLKLMAFRNLAGIGYTDEQIKAIAAQREVTDGPNAEGEMFTRPALASDRFPSPFPNEKAAAAANGGVAPPDLSVMAKARKGGENYVVALLTGYEEPAHGEAAVEGKSYNKYFPGHWIGMPKLLSDGGITYQDGTVATALQQAKDVATFLTFAAEPKFDQRKELGIRVLLFLVVFACLMYATKRQLWLGVEH